MNLHDPLHRLTLSRASVRFVPRTPRSCSLKLHSQIDVRYGVRTRGLRITGALPTELICRPAACTAGIILILQSHISLDPYVSSAYMIHATLFSAPTTGLEPAIFQSWVIIYLRYSSIFILSMYLLPMNSNCPLHSVPEL